MEIHRAIEGRFKKAFRPNKVVLLLGARRTGKTWFLKKMLPKLGTPYMFLNGEDQATQKMLKDRTVANYQGILGEKKVLVIDEAQKIPEIGWILKLMVDEIDGLHIIATGSSVFDLTRRMGEPLTGRKTDIHLYPLAQQEFSTVETRIETYAMLQDRLIFGGYPELLHMPGRDEKVDYLRGMVTSYLLKDILEFDGIRNANKLVDLLRMIAFQTGKEVSHDELSKHLGISKNTVERYLDLLSKVFVIYRIPGFSRNLRKEITRHARWYFVDNGIRNALINNFNPLPMRNDVGALWENYVLTERLKYQSYTGMSSENYFWRTYQQQEIDWIEEREGNLFAYECKWNPTKKVKVPSAWAETYSGAEFRVIKPDAYLDFIT